MIKEMKWGDVRGWLSEGGTLIGTARSKDFRTRPGRLRAAKNMVERGIDALIICGGDGSLTGADLFRSEWPGLLDELVTSKELSSTRIAPYKHLNVVGLVGSIDNDMSLTDATIGCYSSLENICDSVDKIDATAYSHQRAFVVEVMGRHCGWLALMAGVSTGADYVFIPEKPAEGDWEAEMCETIKAHRLMGKRKTIVIVAEGAHDKDLKKISCEDVRKLLAGEKKYIKPDGQESRIELDTRITTLGHVQRGGNACAYDRTLSTLQGVEAVNAVLDATPDVPSPVITINENQIVRKPLMDAVEATKAVTRAIESKQFDEAMTLRDTEFIEHYNVYRMTTGVNSKDLKLPENKVCYSNVRVTHKF